MGSGGISVAVESGGGLAERESTFNTSATVSLILITKRSVWCEVHIHVSKVNVKRITIAKHVDRICILVKIYTGCVAHNVLRKNATVL